MMKLFYYFINFVFVNPQNLNGALNVAQNKRLLYKKRT